MTIFKKDHPFSKIWALLSPGERKSATFLVFLTIIGMVLETLGIGLVIPTMTLFAKNDIGAQYPILQPILQALGKPDRKQLVIGGMLILVAVYLVKVVFLAFLAWRQTRFSFGLQERLSAQLFETYLKQPYTFHLQRNSAELIRNSVTEVNLFTSSVILSGLMFLSEFLIVMGVGCVLMAVEPLGAIFVIILFGLAALIFHRNTRQHLLRWGQERQHYEGLRIQHLQQGMGGVKDVKLLGRESGFLAQYQHPNFMSARVGQYHAAVKELPRLWLELLAICGFAVLITTMILQGRPYDSILVSLGLFAAAAFRMLPSVNRLLACAQVFKYCLPVIDVLYDELNLPLPQQARTGVPQLPFQQKLELRGVQFTYPGAETPALKEITLSITHSESVGFIGQSGSGKSTLIDILLGLLTPDLGEVCVDERNIQLNLRDWQNQIGYVPQSIFLSDDTLRRNVAFCLSDDQIDDAAVWRAIQSAQLEEFVKSLPAGLDTVVGERGVRLSGGQRQRIGVARALYHDPPVLVLDEATSSLDSKNEHSVMMDVNALKGSKTVIIVAHRLSTVEHCDRLYRLESGKIVDQGTPEDILSAGHNQAVKKDKTITTT